MGSTLSVYKVLLVEDNPADILLFEEMLESTTDTQYIIRSVGKVSEVSDILVSEKIDVILLDLGLPDGNGVQIVKQIRKLTRQIPIIAISELEDESVAFQCIQEGVQDYLIKGRIDSVSLRLTIRYSILRHHNAEIEEYRNIAENNFSLFSETLDHDPLNKQDSIKLQGPDNFEKIVKKYSFLLNSYITGSVFDQRKPINEMEELISRLTKDLIDSEDLLDIHIAALENTIKNKNIEITQKLRQDGQYFALEMMGLLANSYRNQITDKN